MKPLTDEEWTERQVYSLATAAYSVRIQTITCFCCDKVWKSDEMDLDDDVTDRVFAKALMRRGWEYRESQRLRRSGPMCPTCLIKPDSERGT